VREGYLAERGIRVIRFWDNDVLLEPTSVLEAIEGALTQTSPAAAGEEKG
jgi:very-short-patch-repair endonuclease